MVTLTSSHRVPEKERSLLRSLLSPVVQASLQQIQRRKKNHFTGPTLTRTEHTGEISCCALKCKSFCRSPFSGQTRSKRKREKKPWLFCCLAGMASVAVSALTYSTVIKIIQNGISCPVNCVSASHSLFALFHSPIPHHCKHGLLPIEWCYILMIHTKTASCVLYVLKGEVLIYRATLLQREHPVCWQQLSVSRCEFC